MKWIIVLIVCFLPVPLPAQIITTFAGNGTASGISGDGGPATAASINGANGGAFDKYGNYYVADIFGHRIRKIDPSGIITTVAGNGTSGYNGDGILATVAQLNLPTAVRIDSIGNMYIGDGGNYRIRKVDAASGMISTLAGTGVSGAFNGDNIPATDALFSGTNDICVDKSGNIYVNDVGNLRIRKINTTGIITTIAGNGNFSAMGTGDGGPATNATFNWPQGLAVDHMNSIYIADFNAAKVRKVDASGIITTIAGNGNYTFIEDEIPATAAQINPVRLTFDRSKNLVIADRHNQRIFKIDNSGIIHCIAGNGIAGYSGDGGPATAASLNYPAGVVYDTCGNLYIGESNRRVRKVTFNPDCIAVTVKDVEKTNSTNLRLYPNPAHTQLTIKSVEPITSVCITNVLGQVVEAPPFLPQGEVTAPPFLPRGEVTVPVGHLPKGFYVVRVNGVYMQRFVKE